MGHGAGSSNCAAPLLVWPLRLDLCVQPAWGDPSRVKWSKSPTPTADGYSRRVAEQRRQLVCLTPVRNEAWILERFLRAASTWADAIIVVDHDSTDGSAEIAERFPKVHLTRYPHATYDDAVRRAMLVNLARSVVTGPRVLIALDADEFVASDAWDHQEMRDFLTASPGTVGRMRWINVLPEEPRAWIPPASTDFMFVDDGSEFHGSAMHGPRLPGGHTMELHGPKVIHLQYTDWERMRSKQRWYQAQERIEHPRKRPIQIYRQYHHMDAIPSSERHILDEAWLVGYADLNLLAVDPQNAYPTDARVLDLVEDHGAALFRRVELWDGRWEERARALRRSGITNLQSRIDRFVFRWLARTQNRAHKSWVRWLQRALRLVGW